jgi:hypothetical protein
MSALIEEVHQSVDEDLPAPVQVFLLLRFREELASSLGKTIQSVFCPPGIDRGAVRMRTRCKRFFWALNRDLLRLEYRPEVVANVTGLLYRLSYLQDKELQELTAAEHWPGIMMLVEQLSVQSKAVRGAS